MEIAQLRALVTIAQVGSFTKAAAALHLTQPALSQQIRALEADLAEQLFERRGRRVTITAAGQIVRQHAEQLFLHLEQMQAALVALNTLTSGKLQIGTSDTVALYLLPAVVQTFRQRYPQVAIHLTNRPSSEVVDLLRAGTIDFGIVTLPVFEPGLESEVLCERREVAVCSPHHPLAAQAEVTLAELADHQLLLLEQGTTSRSLLDLLFLQTGRAPQITALGSIEVLKRYAEIDLGVAIVPAMAVGQEVREGRLHLLHLPWMPARVMGIVRRRHRQPTAAESAFLAILQGADLLQSGFLEIEG